MLSKNVAQFLNRSQVGTNWVKMFGRHVGKGDNVEAYVASHFSEFASAVEDVIKFYVGFDGDSFFQIESELRSLFTFIGNVGKTVKGNVDKELEIKLFINKLARCVEWEDDRLLVQVAKRVSGLYPEVKISNNGITLTKGESISDSSREVFGSDYPIVSAFESIFGNVLQSIASSGNVPLTVNYELREFLNGYVVCQASRVQNYVKFDENGVIKDTLPGNIGNALAACSMKLINWMCSNYTDYSIDKVYFRFGKTSGYMALMYGSSGADSDLLFI